MPNLAQKCLICITNYVLLKKGKNMSNLVHNWAFLSNNDSLSQKMPIYFAINDQFCEY